MEENSWVFLQNGLPKNGKIEDSTVKNTLAHQWYYYFIQYNKNTSYNMEKWGND